MPVGNVKNLTNWKLATIPFINMKLALATRRPGRVFTTSWQKQHMFRSLKTLLPFQILARKS